MRYRIVGAKRDDGAPFHIGCIPLSDPAREYSAVDAGSIGWQSAQCERCGRSLESEQDAKPTVSPPPG